MDKLSIIIPVYNAEATLVRCVESLRPENAQNMEILLVDDGSRDQSRSLCHALAEQYPCITVLENETNQGVSHARNRGLDAATGDWLLFVDSDDVALEGFAEQLSGAAAANPGKLILCAYRKTAQNRTIQLSDRDPASIVAREGLFHLLNRELLHYVWNKVFDRRVVRSAGLRFDEALTMGEDLQFVLDYLEAVPECRCVVIHRPLYNYCQEETGRWADPEQLEPGLGRIRQLARITGDTEGAYRAAEKQRRDFVYHIARNRCLTHSQRIRHIEAVSQDGLAVFHYLRQRWLCLKEWLAALSRKDRKEDCHA